MEWTKQQASAIYDEGGTLLVSAAAGSGKTAVLAERAALILANESKNIAADKLLIVTFTKAAAAEIRARIGTRLCAIQAQNPSNIYLRRQRLLIGRANIGTIDSFCLKLVKQYFDVLNLPADIQMGSDEKLAALKAQTISTVLEKMYEDRDFCEFASLYGRSRSDDVAREALLRLCSFLQSVPFPKIALQKMCEDYNAGKNLSATLWGQKLLQKAQKLTSAALKYENAARNIVKDEELLQNKLSAIDSDIAFFERLENAIKQNDWDAAADIVSRFEPERFKPSRGVEGNAIDAVKALRDSAKGIAAQIAKEVFVCNEAEFEDDRKLTLPLLSALCKAAMMYNTEYYEAKIAQKILDFSDIEHLALNLLCKENGEGTALSAKISAQFGAVMVDEYQDTNELQALLYNCLANEKKDNLFFVGDVKQSIYRFRLAQPSIFTAQKDRYFPYDAQNYPAVIDLGANFRSSKNIIDGINHIFGTLMSREVGGVDYTENERLFNGAVSEIAGDACELVVLEGKSATLNSEAQYICERIKEMVKNKYKIHQTDGTVRECVWGDFCILMRARADFAIYEAELCAAGVPVYTDVNTSLITLKEVSPLVSLLRVIDNPTLDIHVAAVALSLLYSVSPSQLAKAKNKSGLYTSLQSVEDEQIARFCADINRYRRMATVSSLQELFAQVFADTQYFAAVGAYKNGAEMRDNIRAFVSYADAMVKTIGSLSSFLRMVDIAPEKIFASDTSPAGTNRSSVNIMTIHRSKGLQFPICFVAGCGRQFNLREATESVLYHSDFGAAISLKSPTGSIYRTASFCAIASVLKQENISEEMRVLYVALTRAQNKLIITGEMDQAQKKIRDIAVLTAAMGKADDAVISSANSYMPWLCTAALLSAKCELRSCASGIIVPITYEGDFLSGHIHMPQSNEHQEIREYAQMSVPNEELAQKLLKNFADKKEKQDKMLHIPIKMSVSELSGKNTKKTLQQPSFASGVNANAAARGTAMHQFVQLAKISTDANSVNEEIKRLVEQKFMDEQTAALLDNEKLAQFFDGKLWRKMQSAKKLYREYDFITAIDASEMYGEGAKGKKIFMQGIADAIIVEGDTAQIIDYKTDKVDKMQTLVQRYKKQLSLYKTAIEKQLCIPVKACTIYSFALCEEIDVFMGK